MPVAYTRSPSSRLAACQLTHIERVPIDAARAARQHAAYEAALADAGCRVVRLPALEAAPDGVFVEDAALLLGDVAVITRPGSTARAAETASVATALARDFGIVRLGAGRLDGGDVLRVGRTLYVGLSSRTDAAGIEALRVVAHGYRVVLVPLRGCLHLKTAATFLGPDRAGRPALLANPAWVDPACFAGLACLEVDPAEPMAANTLRVGGTLLLAGGAPRTATRLAAGYDARLVDIDELQKAEAGLTCMSLIAGFA